MDFIVTAVATLIGLGFAVAAVTTSPLLSLLSLGAVGWFIVRQADGWN